MDTTEEEDMEDKQDKQDTQAIVVTDRRVQELEQVPQDNSPGALLRFALQRDLPMEKLEKLMDLNERFERREAEKAFVEAMTKFKEQDCPKIIKNKKVTFPAKGGKTEYNHATLDHVVEQCIAALARHGFHHDWSTRQDKNIIEVSCKVTHRLGHSVEKSLSAPPDNSGSKNPIQAIASTVTYLERYTLLQALGLAPGEDDDGRRAYNRDQPPKEAPPGDDDDDAPTQRAEKSIAAYGKYLGSANARGDMERFLGVPAAKWGDFEFQRLREVWTIVKACENHDERSAALREAMFPEVLEPPPDDEAPPLGDDIPM